jgi:hypothetical protein
MIGVEIHALSILYFIFLIKNIAIKKYAIYSLQSIKKIKEICRKLLVQNEQINFRNIWRQCA